MQIIHIIYKTYTVKFELTMLRYVRDLTLHVGLTQVNIVFVDLQRACGWVMVISMGLKVWLK